MTIDQLFQWVDGADAGTLRGFYCGVAVVNDVRNSEPLTSSERSADYAASGQGTLELHRGALAGQFWMTFSDRVVRTGYVNNLRRPRSRGETGDMDLHQLSITRDGEVFVRLASWSDDQIEVNDVEFRGGYLTGFFENRGNAMLSVSFDQAEFFVIR